MAVSRTLIVSFLVMMASVVLGLAAQVLGLLGPDGEGDLVLILLLADLAFICIAVALLANRPAIAVAIGAILGGVAVGAIVFGLLLPFVLEAGDRSLDDYGSDEDWHSLVFAQLSLGVPVGVIVGAVCGVIGWLARQATSPAGH